MPGAELTEVVGDRAYKGLARVKVGPVGLQFAGQAEIVDIDDNAHQATVHAKGADAKGRGAADARVRFALTSEGEQTTRVTVETDLNLTGAVAQYGRASGLINAVAQQIINDFVKNLGAELATDRPSVAESEDAAAPTAKEAAPAEAAEPESAAGAPVSGLSLLFRAIAAMIRGWFK